MENLAILLVGAQCLLTILLGLWIRSYLPAYMKKKGENLATKEDFVDLLFQTQQLTTATKDIESKIEDQVWNRQRQWEMKRDILLEFCKAMMNFDAAVMDLSIKIRSRDVTAKSKENFDKAMSLWNATSADFERQLFIVGLVVDPGNQSSLGDLNKALRDASSAILQTNVPTAASTDNVYKEHHRTIVERLADMRRIVREELGLTPQSRESSAAPPPR